MAKVVNSISPTSSGGTSITVVANYSALPDPTTVSGKFYWCENSQGTAWLPGSLGGTYYSAGQYYSNGVSWSFIAVPYQATQDEVNTGTNTDKFVTPSTFANASKWLTKKDVSVIVSTNQTASNDASYTVVANSIFTDPSPTEGKGYVVLVRNGTATIGGTGYTAGYLVCRIFHSGAWLNTVFVDQTIVGSATQTALDLRIITLLNDNVTTSAVTGTTSNTIIKSYLIPANTLAIGDTLDFKTVVSKTGTNGTATFRAYSNTSNSLSRANALGIMSFPASTLYYSLDRTYTLKRDNTLQCYNVATPNVTDESNVTGAISNVAFDRTVDNYLIIAVQPANNSDSFVQTLCYLTQMKQKTSI